MVAAGKNREGPEKVKVKMAPTRQSNRINQDGVHILEKPKGRVKKKNLEEGNTSNAYCTNFFTVLNSSNNDSLENIASACGINLNNGKWGVIKAMLAEEKLRAATAEVEYVVRYEQILEWLNTLSSENLELGWIDNKGRGMEVKGDNKE